MLLGRHATIVCALVLLSSLIPLGIVTAQPPQGDWIVTGTRVVQNESVTLNGNLTVQSGGSLTLNNVVLTVNG